MPTSKAFPSTVVVFCTPANYIYFDLIVSYLIILTTRFVKLPILWSQISPCRPRKQILLNFFLGLSGRCHQAPAKASSSTAPPPRYLSTPPPPERKSVSEILLPLHQNLVQVKVYQQRPKFIRDYEVVSVLSNSGTER